MRVEGLITNYNAGAAVAPYRIVKHGSGDRVAVQASAAADAAIGVSDQLGAAATGDPMDVIHSGLAEVEFGGNVTRGNPLTADADGKAIAATVDGCRIIGFAEVSGVDGDIGSVLIAPGFYAAGA